MQDFMLMRDRSRMTNHAAAPKRGGKSARLARSSHAPKL
jgi:hypothetical protein